MKAFGCAVLCLAALGSCSAGSRNQDAAKPRQQTAEPIPKDCIVAPISGDRANDQCIIAQATYKSATILKQASTIAEGGFLAARGIGAIREAERAVALDLRIAESALQLYDLGLLPRADLDKALTSVKTSLAKLVELWKRQQRSLAEKKR